MAKSNLNLWAIFAEILGFLFAEIPTVVLDENLKVFTTLVTVGTSLEIKCDIIGSTSIIWKRNGNELDDITTNDIKVWTYQTSVYVVVHESSPFTDV